MKSLIRPGKKIEQKIVFLRINSLKIKKTNLRKFRIITIALSNNQPLQTQTQTLLLPIRSPIQTLNQL